MTITPFEPFELVTMDFITISSASSGYQYTLFFVDHFTKFAVVVHTRDQTATNTAKLFWEHNPMLFEADLIRSRSTSLLGIHHSS